MSTGIKIVYVTFGYLFINLVRTIDIDPFQYATNLNHEVFYKCPTFDTSKIGVVYLYNPQSDKDSFYRNNNKYNNENQTTFRLTNYYSLLLLSKYFKSNVNDRILFYYINDIGMPKSNHYNRWLNDSDWKDRIDHLKFVKIEYGLDKGQSGNGNAKINYFSVLNRLIEESVYHFDTRKDYVVFVMGDTIIGPKIQSCFSLDLRIAPNEDRVSREMSTKCYRSLHESNILLNYYSFLYSFNSIHEENQFSGAFIWKVEPSLEKITLLKEKEMVLSDTKNQIRFDIERKFKKIKGIHTINIETSTISNQVNLHKSHYKQDIFSKEPKTSFENVYCVYGYEFNKFEPPRLEDIFFGTSYIHRLLRRLVYGSYEPITYKTLTEPKIPNIVHLVRFGEKYETLKFIEYLSLKSILLVIKPDKVRIHGDVQPMGDYWNEIKSHPKIEWVHYERPLKRFGQDFTQSPIQHLADVARLDIMYEEGGLYSDLDILWVKSTNELRYVDAELIASNDITSYCTEFPNNIQIGAFMSPPKSKFIFNWLNGYENYHLYPGDYTAISMCEPYKLYEKEPQKVMINNRLQMIYFNGWSKFIPRFIDLNSIADYNENMDWLNNGTYGYHLPRHNSLFSRASYDSANKSEVPIQIATYILNLPFTTTN